MVQSVEQHGSAVTPLNRYGPVSLLIEFKKDKFYTGDDALDIQPHQIDELTIVSDLNSFLPSIKLALNDSYGYLTHILPFDHRMSKLHIQLGRATGGEVESTTSYSFDVFRKICTSDSTFEVRGLLEVSKLFSPEQIRSFSGTVKSTLESIGAEIGCSSSEISPSLDFSKSVVQANWTNGQLLNYLKANLIGKTNDSAFYSFVKCIGKDQIFLFRSLKDLLSEKIKYRFTMSPTAFYDQDKKETFFPMLEFKIYDNYKIIGLKGGSRQAYSYFNFDVGSFVVGEVNIQGNSTPSKDFYPTTPFYLIDQNDDPDENIEISDTGTSNDFTSDFSGKVLGRYHKGLMNLSKIWITTWGLEDIAPGNLVSLEYLEQVLPDDEVGLQYQGIWMIERVIHIVGNSFVTRLLLTRSSVSTREGSTLLKATSWKKP